MDKAIMLRPGTEADLPALLDLWVEAWTKTIPEIDFEARRHWKAGRLQSMAQEGATLIIAARASTILGGMLLNIPKAYLDQLVVSPAEWGKGLARMLVGHACQICPNGVSLTVNAANPRAIRFYEREGFKRTGEGINPNSGLPIYTYQWTPSGAGEPSSPN
jgi:putative acetyltransferase